MSSPLESLEVPSLFLLLLFFSAIKWCSLSSGSEVVTESITTPQHLIAYVGAWMNILCPICGKKESSVSSVGTGLHSCASITSSNSSVSTELPTEKSSKTFRREIFPIVIHRANYWLLSDIAPPPEMVLPVWLQPPIVPTENHFWWRGYSPQLPRCSCHRNPWKKFSEAVSQNTTSLPLFKLSILMHTLFIQLFFGSLKALIKSVRQWPLPSNSVADCGSESASASTGADIDWFTIW